jgi:hypothetical protein
MFHWSRLPEGHLVVKLLQHSSPEGKLALVLSQNNVRKTGRSKLCNLVNLVVIKLSLTACFTIPPDATLVFDIELLNLQ